MRKAHANPSWLGVSECFRALCVGLDTPRSLKAYLLLKNNEFEQLAKMTVKPREYLTADSFAVDYAVCSFLKKNVDMPYDCDRRSAAIAAFASSEIHCKETNLRLQSYLDGDLKIPRTVNEIIHLASRKISRLLAEGPDLENGPYSWGPGATSDMSRRRAYPDTKHSELPFSVTGGAWKHAIALIGSDLHWKEAIMAANPGYKGPVFKLVPGGRYDTVPKTVLTDRSILVEPRLNTILQKRMGDQIRALLKRVGVDLDDQSRNQALAAFARDIGLATLDLESASDTVSRKVVELLLPPVWVDILDDLRSKWYEDHNGNWVRLEKFSSMGNGFTFELESLIFWAISSAASELSYHSIVGVYGDDIIVHQDVVPSLTESLTFLGFKLNREKSFWEGEFFESCGKHYFGNCDVTPAYQKCSPSDPVEACRMGNRILRLACRLGSNVSFDKRLFGAWTYWARRWNVDDLSYGPYIGEGDGYWEAPASHYTSRTRVGPWGPWCRVKCFRSSKRVIPSNDEAMYSIWLMKSKAFDRTLNDRKPVGIKRAIYQLHNFAETLVTIKGTSRSPRKSSTSSEIGYQDTRLKTPYVLRHGSVLLGRGSEYLDW